MDDSPPSAAAGLTCHLPPQMRLFGEVFYSGSVLGWRTEYRPRSPTIRASQKIGPPPPMAATVGEKTSQGQVVRGGTEEEEVG